MPIFAAIVAAIAYIYFSKKPKGIFALFAKKFSDSDVYVFTVKKKSFSYDSIFEKIAEGSDIDDGAGDDDIEKSTSVISYEYALYDKVFKNVYTGWINFRFDIYKESEVCSIIRDIVKMPSSNFSISKKKKGDKILETYTFVDKFRGITLIYRKYPYYHIPSAETMSVNKYV